MNLNKQNKILLGLFAFVVACTIGYALFSENVTITGTATASGNFDYTITCQTGLMPGISSENITHAEAGYQNDSITCDKTSITLQGSLLYPSAARYFTAEITNTGTIPFKIDTENVIESNECYMNDEKVNCSTNYEDFIWINAVFKNKSQINDFEADDVTLNTGDKYQFVFESYWPTNYTWTSGVKYGVKNTYSIPLKQITAE